MQIYDHEHQRHLSRIDLALTPDEAEELIGTLQYLLEKGDFDGHQHIHSEDYGREIVTMLQAAGSRPRWVYSDPRGS